MNRTALALLLFPCILCGMSIDVAAQDETPAAPAADRPLEPLGPRKPKPFVYDFDPKGAKQIFEEVDGVVAVESEHYAHQSHDAVRKWHLTTVDQASGIEPDGDANHAATASGGAYLEILPDSRRNDTEPLVRGVNFSDEPGQLGVLYYPIHFNTPGRYHVWVRCCSTGSEDNGLHVGIDGEWPASGQRMQWIGKWGQWQWDSKQRTKEVHVGVRHQIWIDVAKPGLHTVMFSMREDGFEFDKFWLTLEPEMKVPAGPGPEERVK